MEEFDRLEKSDYQPGGGTALLDAVGTTINDLTYRLENNGGVPPKVLFWIMTDGRENSSEEYELEQVSRMIGERQDDGWQFLFAGADIDAFAEAKKMGIDKASTARYQKSAGGIFTAFRQLSKAATEVSNKGSVDEDWKEDDH